MTSSYSIQKAVHGADGAVVAARDRGHAVGDARRARREAEAQAAAARKRALVYGGAAVLALGVAAIVVVPMARARMRRRRRATSRAWCVEPIGAAGRSRTSRSATTSRSIARSTLTAPAEGDVRVVSEPSGAQVYAGPKLVGTAPVTLHLGAAASTQVTLVHPGYEDLEVHGAVGRRARR